MHDEWDYGDAPLSGGGDTVRLAAALKGSGKPSLQAVMSRLSASSLDMTLAQTGPPPEEEEEEEEEEEWRELRDELTEFFASKAPADDAQGLYAAQKDAFERCMATADCAEALAEGLAQTTRNLVELATHLMSKCAATESELLQAAGRLEERRQRHEQLRGSLAERKKEAAAARGDCKRLERELEAAKLRAERSELQAALYESQAVSLKQELSSATTQLEQMQSSFRGLRPQDEEVLARITLRGKGVTKQIETQQQQAQMNLAALTAELEALELSPRPAQEQPKGNTGRTSGATAMARSSSIGGGGSTQDDEDSGLSDAGTPRGDSRRPDVVRYQQLVNELVVDNDLLQREYLELVSQQRGRGEASNKEANEAALLRAAKGKLENTLREALKDKALLEAALVAQLRPRKSTRK